MRLVLETSRSSCDSYLFCWLLHAMGSWQTYRNSKWFITPTRFGSGSMNFTQLIKQRMFMSCFRLLTTRFDQMENNFFDEPQMSLKFKSKLSIKFSTIKTFKRIQFASLRNFSFPVHAESITWVGYTQNTILILLICNNQQNYSWDSPLNGNCSKLSQFSDPIRFQHLFSNYFFAIQTLFNFCEP